MTKEAILDKVKKVDGLGGMTVNERLFATGLLDTFDKVKKKDRELAKFILQSIQVDEISINKTLKI